MTMILSKGEKTRLKIIHTAFDLFHSKGINATSVDEILEKSQTGKSQFYYYFKSKDDLIHNVVLNFSDMLKNRQLPVKYDIESWDDLSLWFQFFINGQKAMNCDRGCPMATIGYELTKAHELIRQDINLIFETTIHSLSKFFHGLKAKGDLIKQADPQNMAEFCFLIVQGGLIVSKIQRNTNSFEHSVSQAVAYLKTFQK